MNHSVAASHLPVLDWDTIADRLDRDGYAVVSGLIDAETYRRLASLYADAHRFRSRVVMARHGFGRGEYQYFDNPLPPPDCALRTALYPPLCQTAHRWNDMLSIDDRYLETHAAYLAQCHAAGQTKPTPLLLKYETDDYNCLHQDLYGELVFPLQGVKRRYRVNMRHGVSRVLSGHSFTLGLIFHDAQ